MEQIQLSEEATVLKANLFIFPTILLSMLRIRYSEDQVFADQ